MFASPVTTTVPQQAPPPPPAVPAPFSGIGAPVQVPYYAPAAAVPGDRVEERRPRQDRFDDDLTPSAGQYEAAGGRRRRRRGPLAALFARFSAPFVAQFIAQEVLGARLTEMLFGKVIAAYLQTDRSVESVARKPKIRNIAA